MKKALKIIGIVILCFIGLGMLTFFIGVQTEKPTVAAETKEPYRDTYFDNTGKENGSAETQSDNTPRVSASEIAKAYADNEVSADNKYKHQTVIITGTIDDIGKDILDDAYVILHASNSEFRDVQCVFIDKNEVAPLNKGQKISIKGECNGLMMNVQMKDCSLVKN